MKTMAAVLAAVTLSGCAVHNNDWIVPAAVGAVAGVVIHEAVKNPQGHPPPVIVHPLPPRPIYCHYTPVYDAWGYYRGDRRVCY